MEAGNVPITVEEAEDRKERYWGEKRNERRRLLYAQDALYRDKTIKQVKESYRKSRQSLGLPTRSGDCRSNLQRLKVIGKNRLLVSSSPEKSVLTFTVEELGVAINRNTQVICRWISNDMIPKPQHRAINDRKRPQQVYLESEVRAMVSVFALHQEQSQYYRRFHKETRSKLFSSVDSVRAKSRG